MGMNNSNTCSKLRKWVIMLMMMAVLASTAACAAPQFVMTPMQHQAKVNFMQAAGGQLHINENQTSTEESQPSDPAAPAPAPVAPAPAPADPAPAAPPPAAPAPIETQASTTTTTQAVQLAPPPQVVQVTNPPTEAPTLPPTEAPTLPPTEAPTLPPTEPPTQPPTEAPTQPSTEASTTPAETTTAAPAQNVPGFVALNSAPPLELDVRAVLSKTDLPVMIQYSSNNCPKCEQAYPIMQDIAAKYEGRLVVLYINMDQYGRYNSGYIPTYLQMFPTFVVYRFGAERQIQIDFKSPDELYAMAETAVSQ